MAHPRSVPVWIFAFKDPECIFKRDLIGKIEIYHGSYFCFTAVTSLRRWTNKAKKRTLINTAGIHQMTTTSISIVSSPKARRGFPSALLHPISCHPVPPTPGTRHPGAFLGPGSVLPTDSATGRTLQSMRTCALKGPQKTSVCPLAARLGSRDVSSSGEVCPAAASASSLLLVFLSSSTAEKGLAAVLTDPHFVPHPCTALQQVGLREHVSRFPAVLSGLGSLATQTNGLLKVHPCSW